MNSLDINKHVSEITLPNSNSKIIKFIKDSLKGLKKQQNIHIRCDNKALEYIIINIKTSSFLHRESLKWCLHIPNRLIVINIIS